MYKSREEIAEILGDKEANEIWYTFSIDRWVFDNLIDTHVSEYNHPDNGNNHARWENSGWLATNLGMIHYCKGNNGSVIKIKWENLKWVNYLVRVKRDDLSEVYWIINKPSGSSMAESSFLILPTEDDKLASTRLDTIQWTPEVSEVSFENINSIQYWTQGRQTILWTLYSSESKYVKLVWRDGKEKIWAKIWDWAYVLFQGDEEPTLLASISCSEVSIQAYDSENHTTAKNITTGEFMMTAKEKEKEKDDYKWAPSHLGKYIYPKDNQGNLITSKYIIEWYLMELTYVKFKDEVWNNLRWFVDYVNAPGVVYIFNNSNKFNNINKVSFTKYPWSSIKM